MLKRMSNSTITDPWAARISTFFGVGHLPRAPGTWGSLAALPPGIGLMWLGPWAHGFAILLLFFVALSAVQTYQTQVGGGDRSDIVIDEVLGMWIALIYLPLTWQSLVAAFLLFRILDVAKPMVIGWLDRNLKGGLGVIADDVAAGILASLALQIVLVQWPILLGAN